MKKIIIIGASILLILVIAGIIYWQRNSKNTALTDKVYASPSPLSGVSSSPSQSFQGSFTLSSEKVNVKVGEEVLVKASINTGGGRSEASDLILKFDPTYLKLKDEKAPFTKGEAFEKMVYNQGIQKEGLAAMSQIADISKLYNGSASFGSLVFIPLKSGETKIIIDFKPQETRDSNIVVSGNDILSSTQDLSLQILP